MGQYWILVNLSKGEYVELNTATKLVELASNREALRIMVGLLAGDSNGAGAGDYVYHPYVGHWAGDSVMFAGDYGEPGQHIERVASALGRTVTRSQLGMSLYEYMHEYGTDITESAKEMAEAYE